LITSHVADGEVESMRCTADERKACKASEGGVRRAVVADDRGHVADVLLVDAQHKDEELEVRGSAEEDLDVERSKGQQRLAVAFSSRRVRVRRVDGKVVR